MSQTLMLFGSVERQCCAHVCEFYTDARKHKKDGTFRPQDHTKAHVQTQVPTLITRVSKTP